MLTEKGAPALLIVLLAVFISGCAAKSMKPVIPDRSTEFKGYPAIDLKVFIRTMTGRLYSEDVAVFNLGWIHGTYNSFTQVFCQDKEKNLEVFLSPSLGIVGGGEAEDHYEYSPSHYSLDIYYGGVDGKFLSPPQDAQRIGLFIRRPRKNQWVLEKDVAVFGTWYITSVSTGNTWAGGDRVKPMKCSTINRNLHK